MVLPTPSCHPLGMHTPNLSRDDRLPARGFRAPVAAASATALLGLALLLSVGPALGAGNGNGNGANGNSSGGGNGTSGNVKVHDAGTGQETSGGDNEPHVCDFWLGFTLDAPFEAGTWVVVSWAPTGDGSTVASGVYDTAGDGIDSSGVIEVPAGHYRVEWAPTGATVSKKKTFWVDAECDETETPADESPAEEGSAPPDESPAEESATSPEESAPPVDEIAPPADESPAEELGSPDEQSQVEQSSGDESPVDESQAEEADSTVEDSPVEDPAPPADETPLPVEELDLADESVVEEPGSPDDASVDEQPDQAADPSTTDAEAPPMQDQLGGTGVAGDPTMSDTAVAVLSRPSGLPTAFVALLLTIGLSTARRRMLGAIPAWLTASRVRIPLP